ncbi:MAG TPA: hypothetical protein VI168_17405 [Croceibacterium sp.]
MIDKAFQLGPRPRSVQELRLAGLLAVALLPSLSGCIAAAVAVPLISAVSIAAKGVRVRAATPVPETRNSADGRVSPVQLTSLTELPAPGPPGIGGDPWQPFVGYALQRAAGPELTQSALLSESGSSTLSQRLRDCPEREPAVIVDLDDGPTAFSPGMAGSPAPGLAEGLARLREAGVIVLWISRINANHVREVADALVVSGLDPTGRDPLLLVRNDEDRKQTLREEANLDVCVIAIAGDRRSDFDELFDFLRDPNGALALEGMFGAGWFIAPVPFGHAPAP